MPLHVDWNRGEGLNGNRQLYACTYYVYILRGRILGNTASSLFQHTVKAFFAIFMQSINQI